MTDRTDNDDLSAGDNPQAGDAQKANSLLSQTQTRAKYIKFAVLAALATMLVLGGTMVYVVCSYIGILKTPVLMQHAATAQASTPAATASSPPASGAGSAPAAASSPPMPSAPASAIAAGHPELPTVATSFVAMTSALVISLTVIALSLLRAAFAFAEDPGSGKGSVESKSASATTLPSAELLKAVAEAVSNTLSAIAKSLPGSK